MKHECPNCKGLGWVCENHPKRPWSDAIGCTCGAGMMCKCQRMNKNEREGIEEPDVSQVLDEKPSTRH
jgi:hypothetical protein